MEITPNQTFTAPIEGGGKPDFTGLFLTLGFVIVGSAALYVAIRSIKERNENLGKAK